MEDLIEALQIFAKYQHPTRWPTHCEHDVLTVVDVSEEEVSEEDRKRLDELGFIFSDEYWISHRFGSA